MSVLGRVRSLFYGGDRRTQDRLSSILRGRSHLGGAGPGIRTGFDEPPMEPVVLDADLPWELLDDEPAER